MERGEQAVRNQLQVAEGMLTEESLRLRTAQARVTELTQLVMDLKLAESMMPNIFTGWGVTDMVMDWLSPEE